MPFAGFPRKMRSTPVPNQLFGPLLEQIDDLNELKCTLRVLWLLQQKRGYPRFLTLRELLADQTLARSVASDRADEGGRVEAALQRAVDRGTLVSRRLSVGGGRDQQVFALNAEADRTALGKLPQAATHIDRDSEREPWEGPVDRPNIFALYENNIGMLNPMIAEQLKEAEQLFPAEWIESAFREAVSLNKRSWRYIHRILEQWEREGRSDGRNRRGPQAAGRPKHARY